MLDNLLQDGFSIVPELLDPQEVLALVEAADSTHAADGRTGKPYAVRNLLEIPAFASIAVDPRVVALIRPLAGDRARAVRGIWFDKTPQANWKVPWHQDLSIAVREKIEVPGFGPWSVKEGVVHVQPPGDLLAQMVTIRIHLDTCDATNGPLKVVPGSHRHGVVRQVQPDMASVTECHVPAGGAMLMRPLLFHASSAATAPGHRRLVHLEYAGFDLPGGLRCAVDDPLDILRYTCLSGPSAGNTPLVPDNVPRAVIQGFCRS